MGRIPILLWNNSTKSEKRGFILSEGTDEEKGKTSKNNKGGGARKKTRSSLHEHGKLWEKKCKGLCNSSAPSIPGVNKEGGSQKEGTRDV